MNLTNSISYNFQIDGEIDDIFINAGSEKQLRIIDLGCKVFKILVNDSNVYINNDKKENEKIIGMLEELNYEKNERINELNHRLRELQENLENLKNKYMCDNVKKGQDGERSIEQFIECNMTDVEIEVTAKQTAAGDMILLKDNMKILCESKNKYHITKDDIVKFKRDVLNTNCEIGIFVCTKNVNIPFKGQLFFEIYESRPLIYISNFENESMWLKMAIEIGIKIVKRLNIKNTDCEKQCNDLFEFIKTLLPLVKEQQKNIQNIQKSTKTIERMIIDKIDKITE